MDPVIVLILVLAILWVGGVGVGYTLGGLIHALLLVVIVLALLRLIQGRNI